MAYKSMWRRFFLLIAVFVLLVGGALQIDLVHSDPGLPIEDLPVIMGAMAVASFVVFRPKKVACRAAIPALVMLCLAIFFWCWAGNQYSRATALQLKHGSLFFPGLYFPRDSLRYTYTAIAETDRPQNEVEPELLSRLKAHGVPVSALRVHFLPTTSTNAAVAAHRSP